MSPLQEYEVILPLGGYKVPKMAKLCPKIADIGDFGIFLLS